MSATKSLANKASKFDVIVRRSSAGLGLYAEEAIPKGARIIEYTGPRITDDEVEKSRSRYLFAIADNKTIEGSGRDNIARYINHSCRPNCEPRIERGRVFIYAKRAIKPGEELAYHYGKEYFETLIEPHGCRCVKCSEAKAA